MYACRSWVLLGLFGCIGLVALTTRAQGQIKILVDSPRPAAPSSSVGEWEFDGNSWQYKEPGTSPAPIPIGPKPTPWPANPPGYQYNSPPLPVYPGMQPYPFVQPGPAVQITIGSKTFSIGSAPPPVVLANRWLVTYKKDFSDPWNYYGFFSSQAAAFEAAHALSQKGFYAGVTGNNYP